MPNEEQTPVTETDAEGSTEEYEVTLADEADEGSLIEQVVEALFDDGSDEEILEEGAVENETAAQAVSDEGEIISTDNIEGVGDGTGPDDAEIDAEFQEYVREEEMHIENAREDQQIIDDHVEQTQLEADQEIYDATQDEIAEAEVDSVDDFDAGFDPGMDFSE